MSSPDFTVPLRDLVEAHEALKALRACNATQPVPMSVLIRCSEAEGALRYWVERVTRTVRVEATEGAE